MRNFGRTACISRLSLFFMIDVLLNESLDCISSIEIGGKSFNDQIVSDFTHSFF